MSDAAKIERDQLEREKDRRIEKEEGSSWCALYSVLLLATTPPITVLVLHPL
jgi:hypothetical protein